MIGFNTLRANFDTIDWAWHDIVDRCAYNVANKPSTESAAIAIAAYATLSTSLKDESNNRVSLGVGTYNFVGGVLAPNGLIYFIPYNSDYVVTLSTSSTTFGFINQKLSTSENTSTGQVNVGITTGCYAGGVLCGKYIYCVPYGADWVLKIDTEANTIKTIGDEFTSSNVGTTSQKWWGGVLAPNGCIYCAPCDADWVLKIDPKDDSTHFLKGTDGDEEAYHMDNSGETGDRFSGAVLGANGKIYLVPKDSPCVCEIDPVDDSVKFLDDVTFTATNSGIATDKWNGGVLAPNGIIYCIPDKSNRLLKINTRNNVASVKIGSTNTSISSTTTNKYAGGVLSPNGRIYAMSYSASNILEIIPDEDVDSIIDTISTFGSTSSTTNKWMGCVMDQNGYIYSVPYNNETVCAVRPANYSSCVNFGLATLLSPYLNKF